MAGSFLECNFMIAKEVTAWGTAETTGFVAYPILTFDCVPAYDIYSSQMITGAAGEPAPAFGVKRVAGSVSFEAHYGMDSFLYGILGSQASTGAGDPFTNNYSASASLPSFTILVSYGNIPTGKVYRYVGVKFTTWEFSFDAAQGFATVTMDFIAKDETATSGGLTAVAATQTVTHEPIQVTPSATLVSVDIGIGASAAYCVRSGSVRIDRKLSSSRICLGSDTIKEPVPTLPMEVVSNFQFEFADDAVYRAMIDKTVHTTSRLGWDGGTHTFDIYLPRGVYTNGGLPPIQQGDYLVAPLTLKSYGTGGTALTSDAEPINFVTLSVVDSDTV